MCQRVEEPLGLGGDLGFGDDGLPRDVDGHVLPRAQGPHDVPDRGPGSLLQLTRYGQRSEDDGQVGLDRLA